MTEKNLRSSLEIFEVKPGVKFGVQLLKDLLPDVETLLFFAKVYELDHIQLGALMSKVLDTKLSRALFAGDHSTELQDYLCDEVVPYIGGVSKGDVTTSPNVPHGEILPHLWEMLEIEVAKSIKDVALKLKSVVGLLPGKQGNMVFRSMMVMNAKRPTIGDHRAAIHHAPIRENLLLLDVSSSMSQSTVEEIVDDVVALSYKANAHLAVVSNTTTHWEPGGYDRDSVMQAAEFGGTHYETLGPLLDRDWGTVITVADYDSSESAKRAVANAAGHIDTVLDVSLVDKPTYMAECVGQLASNLRPLLVAQHSLTRNGW